MFLTYCWVMLEPPWTALCCRSLIRARRVPFGSSAPSLQYRLSSIATTALRMFGEIWSKVTGSRSMPE